jgi:hypothetical protein
MEEIKVSWYNHRTNTKGESTVSAYSLTDAIDYVRCYENYEILVLKVEYNDIDKLINSL